MEHLRKAYDVLDRELEEIISSGEVSKRTVDMIDELTHGMKSILTVEAMNDRGHSGRYYEPHMRGRVYRGGYSRDGEKEHLIRKLDELRMAIDNM